MEKYINPDFNTRYIINLLERENRKNHIEEIKFRISETSEVQFLYVLNNVIFQAFSENNTSDKIDLTKQDLEIFFYFGKDNTLEFPTISNLEFNCIETHCFTPEYNSKYYFELYKLIDTLKFKISIKKQLQLEGFDNAIYGTYENPKAELNSITIADFLLKALEYNLNHRKKLELLCNDNQINDLNNYNLNTPLSTIKKLYNELEIEEFIDVKKTSIDDFCLVLKNDWYSHNQSIYLNMDNLQTDFFFKNLKDILSIDIKIISLEKGRNIKNKNGFIKSTSLYASKSKAYSPPKKSDLILNLIKKVKI